MLVVLTTLLLLHPTLGWNKSELAPAPTDCADVSQQDTYCGVTFYCSCLWKMPTMLGTDKGCGLKLAEKKKKEWDEIIERDSEPVPAEWHPVWFPTNKDRTLYRKTLNEEEEISGEEEGADSPDIEPKEELLVPEDLDTEGCGILNREETMLSLRPATIHGIKGSQYMPGNIPSLLRIIHERTGGRCSYKNRSVKQKPEECLKANLKMFGDMNDDELGFQFEQTYAMKIILHRRDMADTVVSTVRQAYAGKYNMPNPCRKTKNKKEIVCKI